MDKRSEFSTALKEALKNKDKVATSTLRLIMAALKDRDIAIRESGKPDGIDDSEILLMLQSMVKQRQESARTYSDAGRDDLAEQEEMEIEVIKSFMPKQLDDSEVDTIIGGIIAEIGAKDVKDMGKVMAVMKTKYAGQVDMGKAGAVAKKKLG
jgi:uncharacterized protein YqeY